MTEVLQGAFVVAALLTLAVVVVSARDLARTLRGEPQPDFPALAALQGGLLFCGSTYVVSAAVGRLGERLSDDDTLLYAAVFGLAASALAHAGRTREGQAPRRFSRALVVLSVALPVGSGVLAGLIGPV